jgi:hypothetical protein
MRAGDAAVLSDPIQRAKYAEQYEPLVRPFLRAELHLIRAVCKTTPDEQDALAGDGERVLWAVADTICVASLKLRNGIDVARIPVAALEVEKGMLSAVESRLALAAAARYRAEVEARRVEERDMDARVLVARLDALLRLSPDQRLRIAAALAASDDPACEAADVTFLSDNLFPRVPDDLVTRHVDSSQKGVWSGLERREITVVNFGSSRFRLADDDLAEEDHAKAALRRLDGAANALLGGVLKLNPANAGQFLRLPSGAAMSRGIGLPMAQPPVLPVRPAR